MGGAKAYSEGDSDGCGGRPAWSVGEIMPDSLHLGPISLIVLFLAAAIASVLAFRRIGLSAVLGYLVAGLALGPSGFAIFTEPQTLTGIAEIGVVMFLFVIGLELKLDG